MHWTERVIAAHKKSLTKQPADRRSSLITCWEQFRSTGVSKPVAEMALELVEGNANEVELGFYVLMGLALTDPSLQCHVRQLVKHKSAKVRRSLAFFLSRELPDDITRSIFAELLRDKAASVRVMTIETIGMRYCKAMLAELHALRSSEQNAKVIQSLDDWIPLVENGYRAVPSQEPGCFEVSALNGDGVASRTVEASATDDPRINAAVEELRRFQ